MTWPGAPPPVLAPTSYLSYRPPADPVPPPGPPPPAYGWIPAYEWDPRVGWVPRWLWDPQRGWVHAFIWAPLPPGWGPPAPWPAGPQRRGEQPHDQPTPYLHLLRTPTYGWWKSLLGLLLAAAVWIGLSVVLVVAAAIVVAIGGGRPEDFLDVMAGDPLGSPGGLLVLNLTLAAFIPSVWVAVVVVHQERIGWVSSVARRLRWRLLLGYGLVATVLLGAALLLAVAFVDPVEGTTGSSYDAGFVLAMLAVVLLTTPLQAAGEEYLFRGYLAQAIAGWIRPRLVAAVVSGLLTGVLFALAHGSQDVPTFASRLAFGLTASVVVYLTGGLEAAIAYHAMNNVLIFLAALAVGPGLEVEVSSGLVLVVDLAAMVAFIGTVLWWSRRRPPQRLAGPSPSGDAREAASGPVADDTRLGSAAPVG